jgi:type IV secretion system protein TrbL
MIQSWLATFETSTTDIFIMVGSAVVMLALTKSVPDMVQALINGTSVGSGSAITGAAVAVGAATLGTAAVAVGAGAAVGGAARLASVQAAASADPPLSMVRAARLTGSTMKNLGGAAVEDIGRRLGGRAHHGTMGGRMADSLFQQARTASADLNKPSQPSPPPSPSQTPQPPQPPGANTIRPA